MPEDAPPRWQAICDTLRDVFFALMTSGAERHDLRGTGPSWEDLTRHFFGEELLYRTEVDRAARHVAAHIEPPKALSAGARYYLAFRLQCAMDFLGMVFPPQAEDSPFPDLSSAWSEQQAIEWLLIDLWIRRYDHWLKLNAIGVAGPFPFYGTEPADPAVPQ